jgi:hypothetical protein
MRSTAILVGGLVYAVLVLASLCQADDELSISPMHPRAARQLEASV